MSAIVKSQVIQGVANTDIVLRTAIMAALDDIRANPWILDFFMQSLLHDELTVKYYGARELEEIKAWVIENEITVTMAHHVNNVKLPHISIEVADASETNQTLADINVQASEKLAFVLKSPPALTFSPAAYDKATGTITLPVGLTTDSVFPGMRVLDRVNNAAYLIESVVDDTAFRIAPGVELNLTRAQVVNADDLWVARCESVTETETFNIDCIVQGDATKTLVLQYLTKFILYKYKRRLLEARGYENTVVRSSGLQFSTMYGKDATQLLWKRAATVTGFSMTYWPADVSPPIQGVRVSILYPVAGTPETSMVVDASWQTTIDEDADALTGTVLGS